MVCACACLHPVQPPCLLSRAALTESSIISPSWKFFWKSSMFQENVAWLKMSRTARTLLAIGVVEVTGFRQLFYCVVALLHLWINQGLCQTGWKSKVKADHALIPLSFVLSLPFPAASPHTAQFWTGRQLSPAAVEVKPQEKAAVISGHCSRGADLAVIPGFPAGWAGPAPDQRATCSAKQDRSPHLIACDSPVDEFGDDGTLQWNAEHIWDGWVKMLH